MRNFLLLAGALALGIVFCSCGEKGGVVVLKTDIYTWTAASLVPIKEYNENLGGIRSEESLAITAMYNSTPFSGKYYSVFKNVEKVWTLDKDGAYILNARNSSQKKNNKPIVHQELNLSGGSTQTVVLLSE
jgi:hypothetical protein